MMSHNEVTEKLCEERRTFCEEKFRQIDRSFEEGRALMKTITEEIRAMVWERATDRAWAILGKYGVGGIVLISTLFGLVAYWKN
jgi:hypothetical protein